MALALDTEGVRLWGQIRRQRRDLVRWQELVPRLLVLLIAAQTAAAQRANGYVSEALAEQGESIAPVGAVAPSAFAGVASDGRPLESLLWTPVVATRAGLARGLTLTRAMTAGRAALSMILHTQVSDAGRVADQVAIAARPKTGFVRMLVPPSCSRCAVLAGRFYRYNAGFRRHPRCNCVHVPVRSEGAARSEGLLADSGEYFRSLSRAEQDRVFTKAGAKSIRLGADMNQVVNARRGAAGLAPAAARLTPDEARALKGGRDRGRIAATPVFGQDVFATTEGTTTRGLAGKRLIAEGARLAGQAEETVRRLSSEGVVQRRVVRQRVQIPRLMPESILEFAGSQDEAIRLLRRFGYII